MLSLVYGLISKYQVDSVYIDGANPSFIKSLKLQIGEDPDYDKVIARYRSEGSGDSWGEYMKIVPVNFNKELFCPMRFHRCFEFIKFLQDLIDLTHVFYFRC